MPEKAPSPRRAAYLRTVRREKRRGRIWQIALVAGLFAVWELSCRLGLSDGFLVSSPSRVAATFLTLCRGGDVLVHVGVSCWETVVGFLLGTAAGTVVAVRGRVKKMVPSGGEYLMALSNTLTNTWRRRAGSAQTGYGSGGSSYTRCSPSCRMRASTNRAASVASAF